MAIIVFPSKIETIRFMSPLTSKWEQGLLVDGEDIYSMTGFPIAKGTEFVKQSIESTGVGKLQLRFGDDTVGFSVTYSNGDCTPKRRVGKSRSVTT